MRCRGPSRSRRSELILLGPRTASAPKEVERDPSPFDSLACGVAPACPARRLPGRVPDALTGDRVDSGRRDCAAVARLARPPPRPARRQGVPRRLRFAVRRGRRRARRRAGPREVAVRRARQLQRHRPRRLPRRPGAEVAALPHLGARPLPRGRPVRRAAPVDRGRAFARPAAPRLPGRDASADGVARARGCDLCVVAVAARGGAEHVLRRTAVPDRAARVDRAWDAAACARSGHRCGSRGRPPRRPAIPPVDRHAGRGGHPRATPGLVVAGGRRQPQHHRRGRRPRRRGARARLPHDLTAPRARPAGVGVRLVRVRDRADRALRPRLPEGVGRRALPGHDDVAP